MPNEPIPDPQLPLPGEPKCEFVSRECAHRFHINCFETCDLCGSNCLCACHRWRIPIGS